jgi:hypothetical protein
MKSRLQKGNPDEVAWKVENQIVMMGIEDWETLPQ